MFNLVFMQEWGYVEDKGEWNIKITPLEVQERRIEKKIKWHLLSELHKLNCQNLL